MFIPDLRERLGQLVIVGDVGLVKCGTEFVGHLLSCLGVQIPDGQGPIFLGEKSRDCKTHSGC